MTNPPLPSDSSPVASAPSAPASPPLTSSTYDRIRTALDLWRTRLLDLSKRNRGLNFKPTKVSTVTIVDEQPAEVFRHLCIEAKPMRFAPTLRSVAKRGAEAESTSDATTIGITVTLIGGESAAATEDTWVDPDSVDESEPVGQDFAPYDPEALDDRHRDDILQAQATPEALDKALRRLDELSRGTLEEQGVNVLFLALGMLHYTESADSDNILKAPLLMVPVRLSRRSARSGYIV